MEIRAALEAVRSHADEPLEVVSDSKYVVDCFRDRWWEAWIARGWKNSKRQPVANRDLWEPMVAAVNDGDVTFRWVKGHSGDAANDLVDALAVDAAVRQKGRSGTGEPKGLDLAGLTRAQPGSRSGEEGWPGPGVAPPEGRRLLVGGMRAADLGSFDNTPETKALRRALGEIVAAKAEMHDDLLVVSGLSLGSEMIGAEAALEAGVGLVAVVPFPDFERRWPEETRRHYADVLDHAAHVVRLETKSPSSTQKFQAAMRRRDAWLVRAAHEAVVVWDNDDSLTGRLVKSLGEHLDETDVWIVDPNEVT
jgi:uncharacterized phage-like protein YoqJ